MQIVRSEIIIGPIACPLPLMKPEIVSESPKDHMPRLKIFRKSAP